MVHEIKVPQLGVNDDFVVIVEWLVKDGDKVVKGQPICLVETSKTTSELNAEESGFIKIDKKELDEAKIKETIGYITPSKDEKIVRKERLHQKYKATRRAIALAEQLGVDLSKIQKRGIIREKDVKQLTADTINKKPSKITLPEEKKIKFKGKIKPSFLKEIQENEDFKSLSSNEKIKLYRKNGANIGSNVKIGQGTIIISEYIDIEQDVTIGNDCYIKTNKLKIGRMTEIGNKVGIVTREMVFGDVNFTGDNIIIGGGGAFGKNSKFNTGNNCLISSECIINTSASVVFGDEVGLSPRVQIYTHNHWQNILKGYYANFGPVLVGDQAYITGNCLIAPNVKIGKGATILANSLVAENVSDYDMVAGVPAKVIKTTNPDLTDEQKDKIMKRLMVELYDYLSFKGIKTNDVKYDFTYKIKAKNNPKVVISFKIEGDAKKTNSVFFDLSKFKVIGEQDSLSDEARNFLRKRGIRFKPIYWRYTADKGYYNQ